MAFLCHSSCLLLLSNNILLGASEIVDFKFQHLVVRTVL